MSGQLLRTFEGIPGLYLVCRFFPDGSKIASGSTDDRVKLWDVASGECLLTLEGHSSDVNSVSFSPDGTKLASGSDDKTMKLWDVTSGECLQTLRHPRNVYCVAFSLMGQRLLQVPALFKPFAAN